MAEEDVKTEVEAEEQEELEGDPIESLAMKIGWNPNHEGGDREKLTAEDFILKSREIQDTNSKQLKNQRRKMETMERGLQSLQQHNETVFKVQNAQLRKELTDLKSRRVTAKEDEDDQLVRSIDTQIQELESAPKELPQTAATKLDPAFVEWVDANEWYEADPTMRTYAYLLSQEPQFKALAIADFPRFLNKVTRATEKEFPDKFEAPVKPRAKPTATSVEGANRRGAAAKTKFTMKDLTPEQQQNATDFETMGVMKKADYIKELADSGQLA